MKKLIPILIFAIATAFADTPAPSFTKVAKEAMPAVVFIKVKIPIRKQSPFGNGSGDPYEEFWQQFFGRPRQAPQQQQQQQQMPDQAPAQASGFIVSADGYILTNNHVVRDAEEIIVITNDDKEYPAKVIGQDPHTDLAVLKIDVDNFPFLTLGNSDELEIAQDVLAIGSPLGLQASATKGIVSAKGRNNLDLLRIEDFIQTDAAITKGNSGGPLMNINGEVIGINTAIVSNDASGSFMGIGFAIPSNIAKHIQEELVSKGEVTRGFMGVILQHVDQDLAQAFELEKAEGALVAEVTKGTPAERAGLKQGDIILKYNNQKVANIIGLRNAVSLMKPGTSIQLSVMRNGKIISVPLVVGTLPTARTFVADQENKLGFEVENVTPEIARMLGLLDDHGVVISKVEPGTPADWANIKKGSLLISINRKKVNTVEEVEKALKAADKDKPVLLLVKQGEATRFVSLKAH